jgi:hypothetical protein
MEVREGEKLVWEGFKNEKKMGERGMIRKGRESEWKQMGFSPKRKILATSLTIPMFSRPPTDGSLHRV